MVLVDSFARSDALLKAKLNSWVAAMDIGGGALRFDVATPWVWGGEFLEKNLEALAMFREKGRNLPIAPARNLILGATTHDLLDRLGSLRVKTLVVVGEDDLLTPVKLSRQIAGAIPGAELAIIPGAGHASCLEKPTDFLKLALEFFQRLGVIQ
jgi:3-oxoadipate enol-lactonase